MLEDRLRLLTVIFGEPLDNQAFPRDRRRRFRGDDAQLMVHPALVRAEVVVLHRAALQPKLPALWRGHRGLARELLLDVLRHLLQVPRVAKVDVGRHVQAIVVVVERAVREHELGPAERVQGVRCGKFRRDWAGRKGRDDVGRLATAGRRLTARVRCSVLQERNTLARRDVNTLSGGEMGESASLGVVVEGLSEGGTIALAKAVRGSRSLQLTTGPVIHDVSMSFAGTSGSAAH